MAENREWSLKCADGGWVLTVGPPLEPVPGSDSAQAHYVLFIMRIAGITLFIGVASLIAAVSYRTSLAPLVVFGLMYVLMLVVSLLPGTRRLFGMPAAQVIRVDGETVTTADGVFHVRDLSTLIVSSEGAPPGRALLRFTSASKEHADLVGWPGVTLAHADELASEIRSACAELGRGANKRFEQSRRRLG